MFINNYLCCCCLFNIRFYFSLIFRLKKHYSTYEPTLQTLKHKYEVLGKHLRTLQYNTIQYIRNWPLPIGAFQGHYEAKSTKQQNTTTITTTATKNPNWPEANQLAIYKCRREVEPGKIRNKFNEWSEWGSCDIHRYSRNVHSVYSERAGTVCSQAVDNMIFQTSKNRTVTRIGHILKVVKNLLWLKDSEHML